MHILVCNWQDITNPQAGGAEVHLHEIFERIAGLGHRVTLVCCSYKGALPRETINGIDVIRVGSRNTYNYAMWWWWLRNGDTLDPDCVVDDINKLPLFLPSFVGRPVVAIIHHFFGNSIFAEVGKLSGLYVQLFENRIPRVYADTPISVVSESTKNECIEKGLPAENLRVIYNAINHSLFPMRITEKAEVPTIVFFGRLKKYKSIDQLITAFVTIRKNVPHAELHILGDGSEREELEALRDELQLQDSVQFFGRVSDEQKSELLSRAHLAINPSQKEGWGITNIEANACGVPVVSADVPGLRDSVREGISGRLYPYGNVDLLAQIVTRLLLDDSERIRLSEGAVRWASTFTWDRSAREMLDLCIQTVANYQ